MTLLPDPSTQGKRTRFITRERGCCILCKRQDCKGWTCDAKGDISLSKTHLDTAKESHLKRIKALIPKEDPKEAPKTPKDTARELAKRKRRDTASSVIEIPDYEEETAEEDEQYGDPMDIEEVEEPKETKKSKEDRKKEKALKKKKKSTAKPSPEPEPEQSEASDNDRNRRTSPPRPRMSTSAGSKRVRSVDPDEGLPYGDAEPTASMSESRKEKPRDWRSAFLDEDDAEDRRRRERRRDEDRDRHSHRSSTTRDRSRSRDRGSRGGAGPGRDKDRRGTSREAPDPRE